ncbi:MAG: mono/diheme cytochrome c family protein [Flavobacteriaceae bacterium]|jgi:mono/diheme cytochrome c family protein|uniref:c-type cytochrome n=1 Tax=Candidatus Marifrigoribacter sp. Uisw_064 TaxID=3230970 RepID=UPI003AE8E123
MKLLSCLILSILVSLLIISCKTEKKEYKPHQPIQRNELEVSIKRGNDIYSNFCISCHLPNGKGVKNIYPPLSDSDYLKNNRDASIKGLKYGLKGEIIVNGTKYNSFMPPMGLGDDEIADVMNYINHSWGNKYGKIVTVEEVRKIKK